MTRKEADSRVAKGIALLDVYFPDWPDRIDLDTLDISGTCVLYQTFGDYREGCYVLDGDDLYTARIDNGFTGTFDDGAAANDLLTAAWREAITARRAA